MQINRATRFIVLAMFGFGLMALFTREANAPIVTIATWRAILVAAVFGVWALIVEGPDKVLRPSKTQFQIGIPYGLFLALASATFVGGYALTTVANTIFFHNLAPIIAFPLAKKVLDEDTDEKAITGALIALGGIALISGVSAFNASHLSNPRFLIGDFLAVASAVGYAGVLVWTKKTRIAELPILSTLFLAWSVGAIGLTAIALVMGQLSISWSALAWTLGLAIVCTNIPFYLLNRGMKQITAGLASVLSMTEVLFATLLGAFWYGESLAPAGWLGGVLVAVGVLYPFFANESVPDTTSELDDTQHTLRNQRALFWLFMLNVGAMLLIFGFGSLLAWLAFIVLLKLGHSPLNQLLEGRFKGTQKILVSALSAVGLIGLFMVGTQTESIGSGPLTLAVVLSVWVDQWFASRESTNQSQLGLLPHIATAIVATQCLTYFEHSAALIFQILALLGIAVIALVTIQEARNHSSQLDKTITAQLKPTYWVATLVICFAFGGLHSIPSGHEGVVETLGEAQNERLTAGLHLRFPPPIETVHSIDVMGLRHVDFSTHQKPLLCGDQSMVTAEASLQYQIHDATQFAYGIAQIDAFLAAEAQTALVRALRQTPREILLTSGKPALAEQIRSDVQNSARALELGVDIKSTHIQSIGVPLSVQDAFLDVISASEEQAAIINKAEAYAASAIPIALGEASATHYRMEAKALQIRRQSEAKSAIFQAYLEGGQKAPELTYDRLSMEHLSHHLRQPVIKAPSIKLWLTPNETPPVEEQAQ